MVRLRFILFGNGLYPYLDTFVFYSTHLNDPLCIFKVPKLHKAVDKGALLVLLAEVRVRDSPELRKYPLKLSLSHIRLKTHVYFGGYSWLLLALGRKGGRISYIRLIQAILPFFARSAGSIFGTFLVLVVVVVALRRSLVWELVPSLGAA